MAEGKKSLAEEMQPEVIKLRMTGLSYENISRKLGIARDTARRAVLLYGSDPMGDVKTQQRRERVKKAEKEERDAMGEALKQIEKLEKELDLYKTHSAFLKTYKPRKIEAPKRSRGRGAVAFLCLGDWHLEERVTLGATNGMNECEPKVIEQRLGSFVKSGLSILEMCRRKSPIDTLVVGVMGDLMSGWIHEGLMRTNVLTPPEATLKGFDFLVRLLTQIAEGTDVKKIIVPCCVGNHSRITPRIDKKKPVETTYEWIIYSFVARWFAQNRKRIELQLPKGYFNYLDVMNRTVRFHHGNGFRYLGGVGGLQIPFRRARLYWNTSVYADLDVFGHFHQEDMGRRHVCVNTIMGYSELFSFIRAEYSPPAGMFFLLHEQWGKTAQFPIVVDEDRSKR